MTLLKAFVVRNYLFFRQVHYVSGRVLSKKNRTNGPENCNKVAFWSRGRTFCSQKQVDGDRRNKVVQSEARTELNTEVKPLGEKVKETTKTASYLGIILLGVGVTGTLFYAVFNELFSSKSPNNVYTKAVKRCLSDTRVEDKLGHPITAFGEETRRGRRQHVQHYAYLKDGKQHLRMRFYLQGTFHKGTVNLEMMENDSGKYDYRYLFVDVNDLAQTTIILEDNRRQSLPDLSMPALT